MRAGNLDRRLSIEAVTITQDQYGGPVEAWSPFITTLRAQIIQASAEEYFRASGEGATSTIIFRTRFVAGVTNKHRIVYEGRNFGIVEVKEIGRRRGLELRCQGEAP